MPEIKKAAYQSIRGALVEVLYTVIDGHCTFTALTQVPSSINAAEFIIISILRDEKLDLQSVHEFYDLQTTLGYRSKKPGQFDYDQLQWTADQEGFHVVSWEPIDCPEEIRQLFAAQIG